MTVNNIHPNTPSLTPPTCTIPLPTQYPHDNQTIPHQPSVSNVIFMGTKCYPKQPPPPTPTYILPTSYLHPTNIIQRSIFEASKKHQPQKSHPKISHNTLTTTLLPHPTSTQKPHTTTPGTVPRQCQAPNSNQPDCYFTTGLLFTTDAPAAADTGARNNAT